MATGALTWLLIVLGSLLVAAQSNPLVNGNFLYEDGVFEGWVPTTEIPDVSAAFYSQSLSRGSASGIMLPVSGPPSAFPAYALGDSRGGITSYGMYQDIVIPLSATGGSLTYSYWNWQQCGGGLPMPKCPVYGANPAGSNVARIDLVNPTAPTNVSIDPLIVFQAVYVATQDVLEWTQSTTDISTVISTHAGQTVRLRILVASATVTVNLGLVGFSMSIALNGNSSQPESLSPIPTLPVNPTPIPLLTTNPPPPPASLSPITTHPPLTTTPLATCVGGPPTIAATCVNGVWTLNGGAITDLYVTGGQQVVIDGSVSMGPNSTMQLEVTSDSNSTAVPIIVTGSVTLGGELVVVVSKTPSSGSSQNVLQAGSITGNLTAVRVKGSGDCKVKGNPRITNGRTLAIVFTTDKCSGMNGKVIAAIVTGSVVGIAVIGFVIFMVVRAKRSQGEEPSYQELEN